MHIEIGISCLGGVGSDAENRISVQCSNSGRGGLRLLRTKKGVNSLHPSILPVQTGLYCT